MQTLISTTPEFDFRSWSQNLKSKFGPSVMGATSEPPTLGDFLEQVENELRVGLRASDRDMIACSAGCGSCCRVNVATLSPEAHNIAAYLRHTCSAVELDGLRERMRRTLLIVKTADNNEHPPHPLT